MLPSGRESRASPSLAEGGAQGQSKCRIYPEICFFNTERGVAKYRSELLALKEIPQQQLRLTFYPPLCHPSASLPIETSLSEPRTSPLLLHVSLLDLPPAAMSSYGTMDYMVMFPQTHRLKS